MRKFLLFISLILFFTSSIMAQFSKDEIDLINSGTADTPFRVLKITDKKDSLFLRQKAEDIEISIENNADLLLLIERLKTTMSKESGVGIAAPQIGISKNIFLFMRIDQQERYVQVAINPRIINYPDETICFERDGCLSIPGMSGNSIRYPWVDVEFTNETGDHFIERLEGYSRLGNFTGVIFQHEFDHLQGILYIDKLCENPEV